MSSASDIRPVEGMRSSDDSFPPISPADPQPLLEIDAFVSPDSSFSLLQAGRAFTDYDASSLQVSSTTEPQLIDSEVHQTLTKLFGQLGIDFESSSPNGARLRLHCKTVAERLGLAALGSTCTEQANRIFCEIVLRILKTNTFNNQEIADRLPQNSEEWTELSSTVARNATLIQVLLKSNEKLENIDDFFTLIGYTPVLVDVAEERQDIKPRSPYGDFSGTIYLDWDAKQSPVVIQSGAPVTNPVNCPVEFAPDDPFIPRNKPIDCSSMMGINVITPGLSPDEQYQSLVSNALNKQLEPYGLLMSGSPQERISQAIASMGQLKGKGYSLERKCRIIVKNMIVEALRLRLRVPLTKTEIAHLIAPVMDNPDAVKYLLAQAASGYFKTADDIRELVESRRALAQAARDNDPNLGHAPSVFVFPEDKLLLLTRNEAANQDASLAPAIETAINGLLSRYRLDEMDHALVYGQVAQRLVDVEGPQRVVCRTVRRAIRNHFMGMVKQVGLSQKQALAISRDMIRFPLLARMIQKRLGRSITSSYQLTQFVAAFNAYLSNSAQRA